MGFSVTRLGPRLGKIRCETKSTLYNSYFDRLVLFPQNAAPYTDSNILRILGARESVLQPQSITGAYRSLTLPFAQMHFLQSLDSALKIRLQI